MAGGVGRKYTCNGWGSEWMGSSWGVAEEVDREKNRCRGTGMGVHV